MTYARGLALVAIIFTVLVLGASGWMIAVANAWASDDLRAGHGNSGFPPQVPYASGEGGAR